MEKTNINALSEFANKANPLTIPSYEHLEILAERFALDIAPKPNHLNPFIKDAYLLGMVDAWAAAKRQIKDSVEDGK